MEEHTTTAAAAEETIASIKKLMTAVGNDDELKQKLEDTLAALTGKVSASQPEPENENTAENADAAPAEDDNSEDDADAAESDSTRTTVSSDVVTEDALAGMVLGFVAGAALVGGGVILHKILTD